MKRDHDAIKQALTRLQDQGLLRPVDVVEAARDESSPLHPCFTWDDDEAAHQFRLIEARKLLQVYVHVEPGSNTSVRAFVSLTSDRTQDGGGYRSIVEVMSDAGLRERLLQDAFAQFKNMRQKYQHLEQLAQVWEAVEAAEREAAPAQKQKIRVARVALGEAPRASL